MTRRTVWLSAALAGLGLGSHAAAEKITLTNGDVLNAAVISQDEAAVVIEHAVLGRVTLPRERVASVIPDTPPEVTQTVDAPAPAAPTGAAAVVAVEAEATQGAAAPAAEAAPDAAPRPGLFGTDLFAGWDRRLEFGINGTDGNTEDLAIRAALGLKYEDDTDRWNLSAIYYRREAFGDTTRNEFTGEIVKDWLIPDARHFYFATGKYEYDEFQAWEHRASAFGGIGYQFHKSDKWDLLGRAGLGGNYEFGDVDDFTPEALLGLEYNWFIKEGHTFSAYTTFFPALEPFFTEFRNISGIAYVIEIDRDAGMSFKFGIENKYESDVEPGQDKNDLKYFASLIWDF